MRVLVCGGRNFGDVVYLSEVLDQHRPQMTVLMHGGARGADRLAGAWAERVGVPVEKFPADWETHGPSAGPRRNQEMLDAKPDLVIAFAGNTGTADMVRRARKAGVVVIEA